MWIRSPRWRRAAICSVARWSTPTVCLTIFRRRRSFQRWKDELNSFSWLRHFTEIKDDGLKRFARTLVLDWISTQFPHLRGRGTWSDLSDSAARAQLDAPHHRRSPRTPVAGQVRAHHTEASARQIRSLRTESAAFARSGRSSGHTATALLAAEPLRRPPDRGHRRTQLVRLEQEIDAPVRRHGRHASARAAQPFRSRS